MAFNLGPGFLNSGQSQPPQMPRVPWGQNQAVTGFALGMMGSPNIHQGFERGAQMGLAGMAGNNTNRQFMAQQQEKTAENAARRAAWNAGMKWKSNIPLTPEDQAALAGAPEIAIKFMPETPDKPTPYTDAGKLQTDLKNGLITQEQYDQNLATGGQPNPATFANRTTLRKDLEDEQGTSRYRTAAPILSSMAKSISDPSVMADLDFVYGMAKIFDPGSVVRETEMGMVIDSQSMPATIKGRLEKILNGEAVLQPQARKDLVRAAATRVQEYRTQAESEQEFFGGIAERNAIPRKDIVRELEPMTSAPGVYTWSPETGLVPAQ